MRRPQTHALNGAEILCLYTFLSYEFRYLTAENTTDNVFATLQPVRHNT